jgi:hypothetical protein
MEIQLGIHYELVADCLHVTYRSSGKSGTNRLGHGLSLVMTRITYHENPHDNDADDDKDESSGIVSRLVACNLLLTTTKAFSTVGNTRRDFDRGFSYYQRTAYPKLCICLQHG